jgi:hypothetical protein
MEKDVGVAMAPAFDFYGHDVLVNDLFFHPQ